MKNLLLLSSLFIFSIAYAQDYQNKQGGNDPIEGIDIIIKKKYASWPIKNPNNNPQIHQINELEEQYLEKISKDWFANKNTIQKGGPSGIRIYYAVYLEVNMKEMHNHFKDDFLRTEGHMGLKQEDIYNEYIKFIQQELDRPTYFQSVGKKEFADKVQDHFQHSLGVYVEEIVKFPPNKKKISEEKKTDAKHRRINERLRHKN